MKMTEVMTEMEKIGAIEKAEFEKRLFVFVKDSQKAKALISELLPYKVKNIMFGTLYNVKGRIIELYYE